MSARNKKVNINLIVKDELGESFSEQILSWALTYGRYIIIITQIVVLTVFFLRFKFDRDHSDLQEAVSQKQAIVDSIAELETEIRQIQGRMVFIRQITSQQEGLIKVIRFLQEQVPSDTTFSDLSLTSEKISFSATSGNLHSFSYLLSRLQKDKKLLDVSLESINRQADGRIEFKINAKINLKEFI